MRQLWTRYDDFINIIWNINEYMHIPIEDHSETRTFLNNCNRYQKEKWKPPQDKYFLYVEIGMMCLAPPPDVGNVGHPLQVPGDGVETDEEPREQQDRDRCDRTNKRRHLQGTNTPGWTHLSELTQVSVWGHTQVSVCKVTQVRSVEPTCSEVEAAPISRPRLWATREVRTPRDRKRKKRPASGGWAVIQYTILQYTTGNTTCTEDRWCRTVQSEVQYTSRNTTWTSCDCTSNVCFEAFTFSGEAHLFKTLFSV